MVNAILKKAKQNKYAIAMFNINNLEWIKGILLASKEANSPVMLGASESAIKYMFGYDNVVSIVKNAIRNLNITQPVILHLDHGSFDGAIKALDAGFDSVMFDGSALAFNDNIEKTRQIIKHAEKFKASVEAEVGSIGGNKDGVSTFGELADVEQCKIMAQLPIACLAAGIGNIHGIYPKNWKGLNFERLKQIDDATNNNIPLVLHGGTGIPEDMIKKAISFGINKINVGTELQLVFAKAIRKYIEDKKDLDLSNKGFDPRKLLDVGVSAIKEKCIEKLIIFGSCGKA